MSTEPDQADVDAYLAEHAGDPLLAAALRQAEQRAVASATAHDELWAELRLWAAAHTREEAARDAVRERAAEQGAEGLHLTWTEALEAADRADQALLVAWRRFGA